MTGIDRMLAVSSSYKDETSATPAHQAKKAIPQPNPEIPGKGEPLSGRVSKEAPPAAKKMRSSSDVKFFFGSVAICAWALFNALLCWSWIARMVSYFTHRSFYDGIEKAQITKLSDALKIVVHGKESFGGLAKDMPGFQTIKDFSEEELFDNIRFARSDIGDDKSAALLAKQVIAIKEKIKRLEKEGSSLGCNVASLRAEISRAMELPIYRELAEKDCVAVNFLQILSIKLLSTDGTETLREYGKKCLGEKVNQKNTYGPEELADFLSSYLSGPSFNVDSFGPMVEGRGIWAATHPREAMHALYSKTHPLTYNASEGNPQFSAHAFEKDGKKINFYYGPGPTGDPLFEFGVLPAYKKMGTFEVRFNHQNTHSSEDHPRIGDAIRMENEQHLHAVISFDKPWAKDLCRTFQSLDDFFRKFRRHVESGGIRKLSDRKMDNGVYIPETLFNDSQVRLAFTKAQQFSEELLKGNTHWDAQMKDPKGRERMGKMMLLIGDTFLMLGILNESFDKVTPEMVKKSLDEKLDKDMAAIRMSGACKQDVDRAIVENISLRLFFRWTENSKPLSADEVCEIAGAVFGRARIVDDRNMQMRRYQILDDLLRFIGGCPTGVEQPHSMLKEYQHDLFESKPFSEKMGILFTRRSLNLSSNSGS